MQAPAISPKLADTLEAFRACGVTLTDPELAWLVELRRPCDRPDDGAVAWIPGAPLEFCGYRFWPLHRRARSWFLRAYALMDDNRSDQVTAFLFAHAHSAPGDNSLLSDMTAQGIRARLRAWDDALSIPDDAFKPLCDRLRELDGDTTSDVPDPDARPRESDPIQQDPDAAFAALMCKAFPGATPEYWLSGIAEVDALAMLAPSTETSFADSPARNRAIHNYLNAVKWIWLNHKHDQDGNGNG